MAERRGKVSTKHWRGLADFLCVELSADPTAFFEWESEASGGFFGRVLGDGMSTRQWRGFGRLLML